MDPEAAGPPDFESYVAVRRRHLRRTAYLLCGDWDRAEDLVQDALTRLYVHWRRASRADSVDAYVRRSLVNAYLSDGRRPWRRESAVGMLPDTAYADASGDSIAERDALRRALAGLGPSQRAVIVLRYWDDLSVEQTADALGCSTGNVKSQSARGLARLRAALSDPEVAR
ncbi:MAG TPA: SigE family RNA polymerase sigma factor [Candidatus Angelobacter sp.]|nr:SigE family RNA polymerase sigma factor [Candidatus Angelobacter sp.]